MTSATLRKWRVSWVIIGWITALAPQLSQAAGEEILLAQHSTPDFTQMSLDDLIHYPVTSVSKKEQKLSEAAAAIHVITQEDIRRSGVTSIPEALRMAPGVQVARVDSHTWAISARGFNDVFANKLLVLQDGRSVYTPLYSGVFWDVQDTLLEDIDRIEVIRGPGATLWGANAVNGVINIITKHTTNTQGVLLNAGAGTEERIFGGVRYGGKLGDQAHFRLYGKYFDRDDSVLAGGGGDASDDWKMGRGGFRIDWDPSEKNLLTLQGDAYSGSTEQTFGRLSPNFPFTPFYETDRYDTRGGNLLGRWSHAFSESSQLSLQSYYDRTVRDTSILKEERDTADVELQYRFPVGNRQDVVVGGGYRLTSDQIRDTDNFDTALNPARRTTHLVSAFVQDEITVVENRLKLTLGSKFEHNDFTGFEFQPSGRLVWTPHVKHTVWGAVSRAVRTPSRAEDDVRLNGELPPGTRLPIPAVLSVFGQRSFDSEKLTAYELGYRVQPHNRVSMDLALFYNEYDDLRTVEPGNPPFVMAPGQPPHLAMFVSNNLRGETYGAEFSPTWQATDWWRLRVSYSYLQMQMHRKNGSVDASSERNLEGSSPHHQFTLASSIDLPANVTFDSAVRYVDRLPALNIGSYLVLDLRLAWRPVKNLELALVGQNLLDSRHSEFRPSLVKTPATEVEHSVYGKITWRF